MLFAHYRPTHKERLLSLLQSPEWKEFIASAKELQRWKSEMLLPPAPPSQLGGAARYLMGRNSKRAQELIRSGVTEKRALMQAMSDWGSALAEDDCFPILFLGLVITLECSFDPRCLYCNQVWLPRRLSLEEWKVVIGQVAKPIQPYIYLTGGEPLLLGEEVWGDDGLLAFAAKLGCAVNINTNATLITAQIALQLVKTGLAKLHISLDSSDPQVQGKIFQSPERFEAVLRGLFNVQIARDLLGANHPHIHINCVLTRLNLFKLPELLKFLLEIRKIRSENFSGKITADPAFNDFAFHLIPVGGFENAQLRPTAAEWKQFYTQTWAQAEQVWQEYQASIGVKEEERKSLSAQVPFASPFLRAEHRMSLDEYCQQAANGIYWRSALTERCYVAPSQAFVLPDGSQHWCGAHAVRRPSPLGNVLKAPIRENIRRNIERLNELPNDFCANCAGATCVINQAIERILSKQVSDWL